MSSATDNPFQGLPLEQLEAAVAVRRWFQEALSAEEAPDLRDRIQAIPEPARSAVVRECLKAYPNYPWRTTTAVCSCT
jgi:hypothetical protein